MSFAIITDSTSDISPARAQELGIYVIPLHVIIEGEDLLDQVQITAQEYVARMAGSEQLPHTSQPSAGEFKELFDRVRADGHDSAIFISLCSEWSACYANASLTAETHSRTWSRTAARPSSPASSRKCSTFAWPFRRSGNRARSRP